MKTGNKKDEPLLFKVIMLFAGVILGLLVTGVTLKYMKIERNSMSPALIKGDYILISKFSKPNKGDIVAIKSPSQDNKLIISRVIAGEFDTVEIKSKTVYINGKKFSKNRKALKSPTILPMKFSFRDNMPPVKLGSREYFLISDNFDNSYDSRTFGKVPEDMIIGKILYIYKK